MGLTRQGERAHNNVNTDLTLWHSGNAFPQQREKAFLLLRTNFQYELYTRYSIVIKRHLGQAQNFQRIDSDKNGRFPRFKTHKNTQNTGILGYIIGVQTAARVFGVQTADAHSQLLFYSTIISRNLHVRLLQNPSAISSVQIFHHFIQSVRRHCQQVKGLESL